ncbi:MAG TPA: hypothetical protein VIT68_03350 [Candidatus Gracilibacteria bacterium]
MAEKLNRSSDSLGSKVGEFGKGLAWLGAGLVVLSVGLNTLGVIGPAEVGGAVCDTCGAVSGVLSA